MEEGKCIDSKQILSKELELEMNIIKGNVKILKQRINSLEEEKKEYNRVNSEEINFLNNRIRELEIENDRIYRKLEAIEYSRSYRIIKKIKRILGGKDE